MRSIPPLPKPRGALCAALIASQLLGCGVNEVLEPLGDVAEDEGSVDARAVEDTTPKDASPDEDAAPDAAPLDADLPADAQRPDVDPSCAPTEELCDGLDNDCDGIVDNPPGLDEACEVGLGACAAQGTRRCEGGALICTAAPSLPQPERCDGIDNDCDGVIDNGFEGLGEPCEAGVGACLAHGVLACDPAGEVSCDARPSMPTAEACDGVDNDCDGEIDDVATVGDPCEVGVGACRAEGVRVCGSMGAPTCSAQAAAPTLEVCDGVDNDCDGEIDELPEEPCDVGVGACAASGLIVCGEGGPTCSARAAAPTAEVCDGVDNDCNGIVDDVVSLGDPCEAGAPPCVAVGRFICANGAITCDAVPGDQTAEVCDGVDNDCDGVVDNGLPQAPCSAGIGACAAQGEEACVDGQWRCSAVAGAPQPEACDRVDNDCDGEVDNLPGPFQPCSMGVGACRGDGEIVCINGGMRCDARMSAPSPEVCDGVDNDCNGDIDEVPCDCGDGVVDDDEACDDANQINGDGCDAICTEEDFPIIRGARQETDAIAEQGYDHYTFHADGLSRLTAFTSDVEGGESCPDDSDTMLNLLDAQGQLIAHNDDHQGQLCSYLQLELEEGDYTLEVVGYAQRRVPTYTLNFTLDRIIEGGGVYQAAFEQGGSDRYLIRPSVSGMMRLRVAASDDSVCDYDTIATLSLEGGGLIERVDDYHEACPYIAHYVRAGEAYILEITPFNPRAPAHAYPLRVQLALLESRGLRMHRTQAELLDFGWELCFQTDYASSMPLDPLLGGCGGDDLLLGCRPEGSPDLTLSADGLRAFVLYDVGEEMSPENPHNGVNWYFSPDRSWGFLPRGLPLERTTCDAEQEIATPVRMCWHTNGGSLTRGYRCGEQITSSGDWERVIYTRRAEHAYLDPLHGYGHHGSCSGWNGCESAEGCADAACAYFGYGEAIRWEAGTCADPRLEGCSLFQRLPDLLDEDWNNSGCGLSVVYGVICARE